MPATAVFYHLIHAGLADTARMILDRALGQGWRAMVRCPDAGLAARLDAALWLPEDSFLPHGLEGGPGRDADQPVLIGAGPAANRPQGLMLLAGADVRPDDPEGLERIWILFDGSDDAEVAAARGKWKALTGRGLAAQYWSDEAGSWTRKTERAAGQAAQG